MLVRGFVLWGPGPPAWGKSGGPGMAAEGGGTLGSAAGQEVLWTGGVPGSGCPASAHGEWALHFQPVR